MAGQGKKIYDDLLADLQLTPNSLPLLAGELVNADQEANARA